METEGIGEGINYIAEGIFLLIGITFFVSTLMVENKSLKIRRIVLGTILILFVVFQLLQKKNN